MSKKLIIIVVLLLSISITASAKDNGLKPSSQLTAQQTPVVTVTQDRASTIAVRVAEGWGEPNARVANILKQPRADFLQQLSAQGEEVSLAGTGDLWIVDLIGNFTPKRALRSSIHCAAMFVAIDADSGDVISDGCR